MVGPYRITCKSTYAYRVCPCAFSIDQVLRDVASWAAFPWEGLEMRRRFLALGVIPGLLLAGAAQAEMTTVTDDVGRQVMLDLPIKKAAVFNTWNAELFRAIGGAASIAGLDAGTAANPGYWPISLTTPETIIGQGQTGAQLRAHRR